MMPADRSPQATAEHLALFFLAAFSALAAAVGYWTLFARESLITRVDNPRALIAYNRIQRGRILDRNGIPLAETVGQPGDYVRRYERSAALVVGYASFVYGASGIEAAANSTLSGAEGLSNSDGANRFTPWWKYEVLGEPPIGRDVQLTLDVERQRAAYNALQGRAGAIVIVDNATGDILAMASSPSFDPARIDADFETFTADSNGPLVNRATLGLYRADALLDLFPHPLDLGQPPSLPIPTRAAEGQRVTPLQMALVTAAIADDGLMPAPHLILEANTGYAVAIMPPADATEVKTLFDGNGAVLDYGRPAYAATVPSGFDERTLGWFIGLSPDSTRAICIVIEDGTAPEAAATAATILP